MPKKPKEKIKPMIRTLAEWAVDDALKMREKYPGKKRTRISRQVAKEWHDAGAPKRAKRKGTK